MFIVNETILDDKFEIRGIIGSGGMGVVYEGYQPAVDRLVAIKLLTYAPSDNSEDYARFEREAMVLSRLSHPHIVRFFSYGMWQTYPYIAMERLPSNSLQQLLAAHESGLPLKDALDITIQIVSALQHAHEQGVFHRDIKPSNVIITEDGQVKLIDFGLAKLTGVDGRQKLTQTGQALGSVMYMSPEQCVGQPVDGRTDLYGVGCLLFHCLTGQPPFVADNGVAVMFQHLNEPVTHSEGWQKLPPPAKQIIGRCMAKKPQHRYADAVDLATDLKKLQAGQGDDIHYEAPQDSLLAAPASSDSATRPARRIALMALSVVLVGVAAILAIQFFQPPGGGAPPATTGDATSTAGEPDLQRLRLEAASINSPQLALVRGNRLMDSAQPHQAVVFLERANTLLDNIGKDDTTAKGKPDQRTCFHIKTTYAHALIQLGDFNRAFGLAQQAIQLSKGLSKQDQGMALDFACAAQIEEGHDEESVAFAERAAQAFEGALKDWGPGATSTAKRTAAYGWIRLAECYMRVGKIKEAEAAADRGLREGRELPDPAVQLRAIKTVAQVKFCQGNLRSAREYMKQWQDIEAAASKDEWRVEYPDQKEITWAEMAYGRRFLGVLNREANNTSQALADEKLAMEYATKVKPGGATEFAAKKFMEEAVIYYGIPNLQAGDQTWALARDLLQRGSLRETVARADARIAKARAAASAATTGTKGAATGGASGGTP